MRKFLKFQIYCLYNLIYSITKSQVAYPRYSVKYRFSLFLSFLIFIFAFLVYRISVNFISVSIKIDFGLVAILLFTCIIAVSIYLNYRINFDWLHNIRFTKAEKRRYGIFNVLFFSSLTVLTITIINLIK